MINHAIKRSLLTIALVASSAGAVQAQGEPVDPYGRPLIGRNDWVRQPGDQKGPAGAGVATPDVATPDMAAAPSAAGHAQLGSGPHPVAFRDEFGFRYDAQGNRLDARGYVISPQTR